MAKESKLIETAVLLLKASKGPTAEASKKSKKTKARNGLQDNQSRDKANRKEKDTLAEDAATATESTPVTKKSKKNKLKVPVEKAGASTDDDVAQKAKGTKKNRKSDETPPEAAQPVSKKSKKSKKDGGKPLEEVPLQTDNSKAAKKGEKHARSDDADELPPDKLAIFHDDLQVGRYVPWSRAKKAKKPKKQDAQNGASVPEESNPPETKTVKVKKSKKDAKSADGAEAAKAAVEDSAENKATSEAAGELKQKKKKKKEKAKAAKDSNGDRTNDPAAMAEELAERGNGKASSQDESNKASDARELLTSDTDNAGDDGSDKERKQGTAARAFQRVKSEEWIGKKGSMDNTYAGTFGEGGWGHKASQVLGAVRGKDFRHEKTKKKRGSYFGGKIDDSARFSFKYDSDDD